MMEGTSSHGECVHDPWWCPRGEYKESRDGKCIASEWSCKQNTGPGPDRWYKDNKDGDCYLHVKPPCGFDSYRAPFDKCLKFKKDAKPKPAPKPDPVPPPKPKDEPKDKPQDKPKDKPQDKPKDPPQDKPKDKPQDKPKDPPQDKPKDHPKDEPKDHPKDEPANEPDLWDEKVVREEARKVEEAFNNVRDDIEGMEKDVYEGFDRIRNRALDLEMAFMDFVGPRIGET